MPLHIDMASDVYKFITNLYQVLSSFIPTVVNFFRGVILTLTTQDSIKSKIEGHQTILQICILWFLYKLVASSSSTFSDNSRHS